MLEKIFDGLKESLNGDKPVLRKMRILRYVSCIVILFIAFCDSYWNLLAYIDLPCVPLFAEKYRTILYSSGIVMLILWVVYKALYQNLYRCINKKYWMKLSYIDTLIDCIFTLYFLLYAINVGIEYANGLQVKIRTEVILSVLYLVYCVLVKSYTLHQIKYEQNNLVCYTGYCDSEGHAVPIDAKVFYKGKGYKVVEHEGIYRLLPYGERIIPGKLIKLEDAASDMDGKLLVQK